MEAQARRLMAQLPYMRRYGRALTGSTIWGDDLVTRALEAALTEPDRYHLDTDDEPVTRRRLYTLLNELFDSDTGAAGASVSPAEPGHPIEAALSSLPNRKDASSCWSALKSYPRRRRQMSWVFPPMKRGTRWDVRRTPCASSS